MNISKILLSKKTVFTLKDLELILGMKNQVLRNFLNRQKHNDILTNIYAGMWVIKNREYNTFELGCKLREKSYISFESVLQHHGVIFQDYSSIITIASDNSIIKQIKNVHYQFKKIKDSILLNPLGVEHKGSYAIASKERAICDILYLKPGFIFDNLKNIHKEKLREIAQIYNKRTILEINQLIKNAE